MKVSILSILSNLTKKLKVWENHLFKLRASCFTNGLKNRSERFQLRFLRVSARLVNYKMKNLILFRNILLLLCLTFVCAVAASQVPAQTTAKQNTANIKEGDLVPVPSGLRVENCPPVSHLLQKQLESYSADYYLNPVVSIRADGANRMPIVSVKEINNPVRLLAYRPKNLIYPESPEVEKEIPVADSVYDLYPSPDNSLYLYNADENGDGQFRFYLYNPQTKQTIRVTKENRNVEPVWSPDGKRIAFGTAAPNQEGMSLAVVDIESKNAAQSIGKPRIIAETGFMLTAQGWSPDGKFLTYIEYFSNRNSAALWLINVQTGEKTLVAPSARANSQSTSFGGANIPNGEVTFAEFSPDGKKLYFAANHADEFIRLYAYDLTTKQVVPLAPPQNKDLEAFKLSPTGGRIAAVYDFDGVSRLFLMKADGSDKQEVRLPTIGIVQNVIWSENDEFIAFNFAAPQMPAAIFYADARIKNNSEAKLVASSPAGTFDKAKFPDAETISWTGKDNLKISGWLFKAKQANRAKRPVVIEIHGGPEAAARPEFTSSDAYYLNAEGAAVIYPNVRGSTGNGKSFLDADNGLKRANAVKDFGKLFEWISRQPDLDANRVMLRGFSYGGYMALLVAATYPNDVAAVSVESAPTNLVSFLETTSGWRRAQRRNEYGDERDAGVRAGLEKLAPRNLTQNLQMPLFVAHGARDPRVPATESEKFVAAVREKGNRNVWFVLSETDGHGLSGDSEYYRSLLAAEFFQKFVAGNKNEDSSSQKTKKK